VLAAASAYGRRIEWIGAGSGNCSAALQNGRSICGKIRSRDLVPLLRRNRNIASTSPIARTSAASA